MKNMMAMYTKLNNTKHFLNGKRAVAGKEKEKNGELKSGSKDMTGEKKKS